MSQETFAPFKLALRAEGSWWVAYFQKVDDADQRIELGRIRMMTVQDPEMKLAFTDLMRRSTELALAEVGLPVSRWGGIQEAPESERSGNA